MGKRKVTYTFYTDKNGAEEIERLAVAKRIRVAVIAADENMAEWARELGVSRSFVSQVVNGKRDTQRVRDFIEKRLGVKFWKSENLKKAG